jgi:hypothetical protein
MRGRVLLEVGQRVDVIKSDHDESSGLDDEGQFAAALAGA